MTDEIHERGLERAQRIYVAYCEAVTVSTTAALGAAFQAAGDALHAEADAATEQRKRGHQSLTKDLRNAAGRLVGIAQDLMELSKMDESNLPASIAEANGHREPYTPATDPVMSDLHTDRERIAAYLAGETDEIPDALTPAMSRKDIPERGTHVISTRMAEDYTPPSGSLNPAATFDTLTDAVDNAIEAENARYLDAMTPGMPDPCQPIGCDAGIHLPGCPFAERDAPEEITMTAPELAFADPEPFRATVTLPFSGAEQYRYSYADLMRPVDPALMPAHWSWSQLTTLEDCGVQYRGQRLEGKPQRPQWANVGGTAFHAVTEAFDRGAWNAGGADLLAEAHPELIGQRWREALLAAIEATAAATGIEMGPEGENYRASQKGREGYTWWLVEGERMLALYVHNRRKLDQAGREAGQLRRPLLIGTPHTDDRGGHAIKQVPAIEYKYERKLTVPTGVLTIKGIIDRAYVCADGSLLVVDLKTGRLPNDSAQLGEYAWTLLELLGYDEAHRHPDGPGVKIMGCFYDARKGLFTDAVNLLERHPREEYVYRYGAADAARRMGVFLPHRSTFCVSCSINYACPVGGA